MPEAHHYQTGVASDTVSLKAIIVTFLTSVVGDGWTEIESLQEEAGVPLGGPYTDPNYTTYFSRNSRYYFLTTKGSTYHSMLCGVIKGHSPAGNAPYFWYQDQLGYNNQSQTNNISGPYTKYHLFGGNEGDGGAYFYCVIEISVGIFAHFGFGELDKIGDLPSQFAVGTFWDETSFTAQGIAIRTIWNHTNHGRMFDGIYASSGGSHISINQNTSEPTSEQYTFNVFQAWGGSTPSDIQHRNMVQNVLNDSPNAMNLRTMLQPVHIRIWDQASPSIQVGWWRIVGMAPGFRATKLTYFEPEDTTDTNWMVFPAKSKNNTGGSDSNIYGYAYRWQ